MSPYAHIMHLVIVKVVCVNARGKMLTKLLFNKIPFNIF